MNAKPMLEAPAPWELKGTVYLVNFWCKAGNLPHFAYSPLEGASGYADPKSSGRHVGGLAQFQVIRYTHSPVGAYDELIVIPGNFEYEVEEGGKRKTKKNARITRIYVSQKHTCWNGRKNWNIPKHLARFEFEKLPDGSEYVKVYPHDTTGDTSESKPSDTPFFQARIKPMRWIPSFPFSLSWIERLGIDTAATQPPLPEGKGSLGELPGTDKWCKWTPQQSSKSAVLSWVDMSQRDEQGGLHAQHENFWPNLGKWQVGMKLENCDIVCAEAVFWDSPQSKL